MRVVVAMSGGVDSAVAAARLHQAGHEVIGVTLHLWDYPAGAVSRCCAPEDQYDARRTADVLGFAHYTFDRRELFAERVVDPFVEAYLAGETPSPCSTCNREVKLSELFDLADRLGASHVATGHYARVAPHDGAAHLYAGRDADKDQSYFLYATPAWQLDRLLFPLGDATKAEVRADAVRLALPGAAKGESQELCFAGDGDHAYAAFVEQRAAGRVRPGAIVDDTGRVVGQHGGVQRFTVGQRKGLGVALGKPAYVTHIDAASGAVHVGPPELLAASGAVLGDLQLARGVTLPVRARVRIRYRHAGSPGTVERDGDRVVVRLDEPARAVTRGQVAVLYDGEERVLGGGRIVASLPVSS